MKSIFRLVIAAALISAATAAEASAQRWGALIDKLQELSGPEMTYYGAFVRLGPRPGAFDQRDRRSGVVWTLAAFYGTDDENDDRQGDVDVTAWRAQLSAEYQIALPLASGVNVGLESGISGHYFGGDIDESFLHPSIPLQVNLYPFAGCRGWLLRGISGGAGVHFVPSFDDDDFAPIPDFGTEDWETPFAYHVALEISSVSGGALRC